ncbi:MAG: hypothetical protein HOE19_04705 [Candidatus Komeilibacteria bacterium]|jgi:hypothetical protein|nr:hypothetical protein [Candidatus Komeilibacteria bacterium]MBT4447969.1 hypothetical protein [Candidatus Komeilibacteria bacterium]
MDKEKRKKILWVIAIVILLLAFLLWVLRTSDNNSTLDGNTNTEPPVFTPSSTQIEYQDIEVPTESPTEFSAINLAKNYAARFGSWSTDNQGNNLNELLPLSTTRMQNYLRNIELDYETEEFMGLTTKSLTTSIVSMDDDKAEILVGTQKIETNDKLEEKIYYQDASVRLVKSADKWLVDEFYWE